ncbi:WD40 repeat domain-containing protein [Lentzea sp. BCCO 10_0061]|uniref:WD40 repeat domain-containing protein n=1 Tax=Lentzea sokolovensis TaxID=3095429 RepID=A0ABU4UQY4_9PSEU|nr:WD40 repeat domain-containing protein [Lentzea sp. BCCO 10_0061]MDX8141690.1 WD40 repeat domain-containing protein [Lentzea sp. BCCO 10_0061]
MTSGDRRTIARRFLISLGIAVYRDTAIPDLSAAVGDAERVAGLLAPMNYVRALPALASTPAASVPGEIEKWAVEQQLGPRDVVVIYIAAHGSKGPDRHYLLWPDSVPERWSTALATEDLARPLMHGGVGNLLIMLDTCFSASGAGDAAVLASELVGTQHSAAGRWTLAAARSKEVARDSAFVDALTDTLSNPQAGAKQEFLSVREVAERVNSYFSSHGHRQRATHTTVDSDGTTPFFINVNHIPGLPPGDLDVATINRLRESSRPHFFPRSMGVDHLVDLGDYFTARITALRELAGWLNAGTHDRRARVVTGRPGSGKSALLGRLLLLLDPDAPARRTTPADALPRAGLDVIPLHARRATCESLTADLASAVGHPDADRDALLQVLAERKSPLTLVVDALDEAGTSGVSYEPARLSRELLQPLTSLPTIRLVVGARRPVIPALGQAVVVIDLDDPDYIGTEDIAAYVHAVLLDAQDPESLSPYRDKSDLAREIAGAIAGRAGTSYLVARMTARALLHGQITVDVTRPGWRDELPSDARQAFEAYLDRFGEDRPKVERLLRPLAYAQGTGLPWSTLWAPVAEALSGVPCPREDLRWLHEHASAYLVESGTRQASAFRLFHETMAEFLRDRSVDTEAHRLITAALTASVPAAAANGRPTWTAAHPYVLNHLATHAAAGQVLDDLLSDPEFLAHANPEELLGALHTATTDRGQLMSAIYRASAATHCHLAPLRRRQLLAADAARFKATEEHRILAQDLQWPTRWATGQQRNLALRATLTGHENSVNAVACCEVDGAPVAVTTSDDHTARVWNLSTGALRNTLIAHDGWVTDVVCTRVDGAAVAVTISRDETACVWDVATGSLRARLTGHSAELTSVACVEVEGVPVAITTSRDETARVWNLRTGRLRAVLAGHHNWVNSVVCFEVAGRAVAVTTSGDQTARVWDLNTGCLRTTLTGHDAGVAAVACAEVDGRPLAVTISRDEMAFVWDLNTADLVATLTGHHGGITSVVCTELDGQRIAITTSEDRTACVWDLRTGVLLHTLTGHNEWVTAVVRSDVDGQPVAITTSDDHTARVWDLRTGLQRNTLAGHDGEVTAVACTFLDGEPVAITTSDDHTVRVWRLAEYFSDHTSAGHSADVTAVACTEIDSEQLMVTASDDGTACVWNLRDGTLRLTMAAHHFGLTDVTCTEVDGTAVAITTGEDQTAKVWDLRTGDVRHNLIGHSKWVNAVACTEVDGRRVAVTTSDDRTVRVWDLSTGRLLNTFIEHRNWVNAVACVEVDGTPLAVTTSHDRTVRVWDLCAGQLRATLTGHEDDVHTVACTKIDGLPVAVTTSRDKTARVWDLTTATLRHTLAGHEDWVNAVACAEVDGRPVAVTTSGDRTARVWDLASGTLRHTFARHNNWINAVACTVTFGQPTAITTSSDGTTRVWRLATGEELAVFDYAGYMNGVLTMGPAGEIVIGTGWDIQVIDKFSRTGAYRP